MSPSVQSNPNLDIGIWECPLCGKEVRFIHPSYISQNQALVNLKGHVRNSEDDIHGGDRDIPADFPDNDTLDAEYVTKQP